MTLNLKEVFQNKKGFTLIELVLWLCLFSILMGSFLSVLTYVNNLVKKGDEKDEILLGGRYAIEYIKSEIMLADSIIPSSKFDGLDSMYENSFGFVIYKENITKNSSTGKETIIYNYSTYYLKNDELIRIAINKSTTVLPKARDFSGFNQVCSNVINIDKTKLSRSHKTIFLHLSMGYKNKDTMDFKSLISLRCPIDI